MRFGIDKLSVLSVTIGLVFLIYLTVPQINFENYPISSIVSKFIYFTYICLLLLGIYTLYPLFSKSLILSMSSIDILLFLMLGYITINRYFIQDRFGFSVQYMELLGLCLLFMVLRSSIFKDHYLLLFIIITISGIIQCLNGFLQQLGYISSNHEIFNITGSFFNPGPFAGFLAAIWPIAFGIHLFRKTIYKDVNYKSNSLNVLSKLSFKYLPIIGMASILLLLIYLKSSASWLAVLFCSFCLLELKYAGLMKLLRNSGSFTRIFSMTGIGIVISMVLYGGYALNPESSQGRLLIWQVTSKMIMEIQFQEWVMIALERII